MSVVWQGPVRALYELLAIGRQNGQPLARDSYNIWLDSAKVPKINQVFGLGGIDDEQCRLVVTVVIDFDVMTAQSEGGRTTRLVKLQH
jgi:hypothetical protein